MTYVEFRVVAARWIGWMFASMLIGVIAACGGGSSGTDVVAGAVSSPRIGWAWMGGASTVDAIGHYGVKAVAAPSNVPGARAYSVSWTDASGNFWLMGGYGTDSAGVQDVLNDLWKYTPSTGYWTWVSGSNVVGATGTYGTQGVSASNNVPGARKMAVGWADASGNLWLMGGEGVDSAGTTGSRLNDLWKFMPATGQWTWMKGSDTANPTGVYGSLGSPAAGNVPGGRLSAVAWVDPSGELWLSGGYGYDSAGTSNDLNDLWKYAPTSGNWTWMSGSDLANAPGTYGTQGTPAGANVPGARESAVGWTDGSGNLWLLGGYGLDSVGTGGDLNDLWTYSRTTGQWTWKRGANTVDALGIYGVLNTAAAANAPGARESMLGWTDSAGNLWLAGGFGFGSAAGSGTLSDLWKYSPAAGQWTWMGGGNTTSAAGTFGTLGVAAVANIPSARHGAIGWKDASGYFWLMGGWAKDAALTDGYMNDLWRF